MRKYTDSLYHRMIIQKIISTYKIFEEWLSQRFGSPVWPRLYNIVQCVAWAESSRDLSMSQKCIITPDFSHLDTQLDELFGRQKLAFRRWYVIEGTDEGNPDAPIVVTVGMCPHTVPATSHVNVTIAANQEIVTNVRPVLGFGVK